MTIEICKEAVTPEFLDDERLNALQSDEQYYAVLSVLRTLCGMNNGNPVSFDSFEDLASHFGDGENDVRKHIRKLRQAKLVSVVL